MPEGDVKGPQTWLSASGPDGLMFDIDPTKPVFMATAACVLVLLISAWWFNSRTKRMKRLARARAELLTASRANAGDDLINVTPIKADRGTTYRGQRSSNERPRRAAAGVRTTGVHRGRLDMEKVTGSAIEQARLCEILYDVYGGEVPKEGIDSKDLRACGLTATEIRRRFRHIRQARAEDVKARKGAVIHEALNDISSARRRLVTASSGSTISATQEPEARPSRLDTTSSPKRSRSPSKSTKKPSSSKQRSTTSPKSPRITPTKRSASSRPHYSPKSTSAAKRASGFTDRRSDKAAIVVPTTPSKLKASAKKKGTRAGGSAEKKKKAPSSPKKNTPAKRGVSSVIEQARRDAELKAGDAANARADSLEGNKRSKA